MDSFDPDLRFGTAADVAWIRGATTIGLEITAGIPPVFDAYATVVPADADVRSQQTFGALVRRLSEHSAGQSWWLGYLDTGGDALPFPDGPQVTLYSSWSYLLVLGDSDAALRWGRARGSPGADLIFPADRSWLVSRLWDDDWRCLGGPAALVDALMADPGIEARRVTLGEDATPPGKTAW